jgi:hypothetical protein
MPLRKQPKNFLEMIPVRNVRDFSREGERITLVIPKFKNEKFRNWFIPSRRSTHFSIHLDEMGSRVWDLIDGETNTGELCDRFSRLFPDADKQDSSLELRVTEFLRQLYKNRFIVFK